MAEVRMKSVMSSSSRRVLGVCPGAGLRWPVVAGGGRSGVRGDGEVCVFRLNRLPGLSESLKAGQSLRVTFIAWWPGHLRIRRGHWLGFLRPTLPGWILCSGPMLALGHCHRTPRWDSWVPAGSLCRDLVETILTGM